MSKVGYKNVILRRVLLIIGVIIAVILVALYVFHIYNKTNYLAYDLGIIQKPDDSFLTNYDDYLSLVKKYNIAKNLKESDFINKVYIDVAMPISYLKISLIEELERLAPYGNGNPKPLFAQKNVKLCQGVVLGKNRNVARFTCNDGMGNRVEAIYFGEADEMLAQVEAHDGICSIVYYPEINEYRGRKSIQIVVKYYDFNS